MSLVPHAGAARRDARIGSHAGHFGHDQARAPGGPRSVVHQVPVARHAILGEVLRHRRDDDAIDQLQGSQAQRQEHRRPRLAQAAAAGEIAFDGIDVARIAQAQDSHGRCAGSR